MKAKIKKFLCKIGFHDNEDIGIETAIDVVYSSSESPIQRVVYSCKNCGKKSYFCLTIGFKNVSDVKWK